MRLAAFDVGVGVRLDVPVRITGGRGILRIGDRVVLGYALAPRLGDGGVLLQPRRDDSRVEIGAGTMISNNVSIIAVREVRIGRECLIGDLVCVFDSDFHDVAPATRLMSTGCDAPVMLADRVWLGSRVMVLRGVSIGENSIIGAGSVVTRSIPANCIAAGAPARVVRDL